MQYTKNAIKQLIAQNRLEEAIDILMVQVSNYLTNNENDKFVSGLNDTLLINSGKLHGLKRDDNIGKISTEDKKVSRAEIQSAILYIIDELPDSTFQKNLPTSTGLGNVNRKQAVLVVVIVAVAIVGYLVIKSILPDNNTVADTDTAKVENRDTGIIEDNTDIVDNDTASRSIEIEPEQDKTPPPTAKLTIEVWTGRGKKPVLTEGDTANIYFRVTKPCYVRLIYKMADGSAVLLADNYKVTETKINKKLSAPTAFGVGAPFGNELLSAYAQSEPFDKVITKKYGKYDIIAKSDLNRAIETTQRGLYKLDVFVKTNIKFVTKPK